MSTYSEKSWNSSDDYEDDNSSTSSTVNKRMNNGEVMEVNGNSVITTHCVSTVIKPGDKQLHDPLQFVKIKSTELSQKAKEQIKLAEEVKITKEKIKEVEEEWQNNLLSWKSKRRQSKKESEDLEEQNFFNNSRKIKTFNEILNEKAKSGQRIGYNLHQYIDEKDEPLIENKSQKINVQKNNDQNELLNQQEQLVEQQQQLQRVQNLSSNFNSETETDFGSNHLLLKSSDQHLNNELQQNNHENTKTNGKKYDDNKEVDFDRNSFKEHDFNNEKTLKQVHQLRIQNSSEQTSNSNFNTCSTIIAQNQTLTTSSKDFELNLDNQKKQIKTTNEKSELNLNSKSDLENQGDKSNMNQQINNLFKNIKSYQLTSDEEEEDEHSQGADEDNENLRLSFKAKLSAFENLARNENKKPDLIKSGPIKNKLRMSSSNNMIHSENFINNKSNNSISKINENLTSNNKQRYSSKSNENLSKLNNGQYMTNSQNNIMNNVNNGNRNNFNSEFIKSENNLNNQSSNQNQISNSSQSDLNKLNNEKNILNRPNSSNELYYSNNTSKYQYECDSEVNDLTKRMQNVSSNNVLSGSNQFSQNSSTNSIKQYQEQLGQPVYYNEEYNNNNLNLNRSTLAYNSLAAPLHQTNAQSQVALDLQQKQQLNTNLINQQIYLPNKQNLPSSLNSIPCFEENNNLNSNTNPYLVQNASAQYSYYAPNLNVYPLAKNIRSTSSSQLDVTSNNIVAPIQTASFYQPSKTQLQQTILPTSAAQQQQILRKSQPHLQANQSQQPYNYNHWLIQEAELRRQMATQNNNLMNSNSHQNQHINKLNNHPINKNNLSNSNSAYKDDQPVYENTIIYNSHKQQQTAAQHYIGQQQPVTKPPYPNPVQHINNSSNSEIKPSSNSPTEYQQQKNQKQILSVSGRKKCSNCGDELGRGCAAMVIETLSLYYHINCFRCSVCHVILGNGTCGTDVRVRNHKLHCQNCYSNDEVSTSSQSSA